MWIGIAISIVILFLMVYNQTNNTRSKIYKFSVVLAMLLLIFTNLGERFTGIEIYPEYIIGALLILGIGAISVWQVVKRLEPAKQK